MKIELKEITIRQLAEGYIDNAEEGVVGYSGKLDIRPPYQREFVYKDKQRDAVIDTVKKNFPLNVMYWAVQDDGNYEVIDGQQRTISICQFVHSKFSYLSLYFHNLQSDEQEKILDYKLMVYLCSGTDSEKLQWFKTINIAGVELTQQELRNAVYSGPWVTNAKRYFSKTGCPAYQIGHKYVNGKVNRQEFLETAISWISKGNIKDYMATHQYQPDASELWEYFENVIKWIESTFTHYRDIMKGVDWGSLYDKYKDENFDTQAIEEETRKLIDDEDVTKYSGIYPYILTRNEKYLSIRSFTKSMKRKVYERQNGKCVICGNEFDITQMEADHITPWHEGGKTSLENCQLLCKEDNRRKSGK
ncbi:MAG: DUF262 domain-containing protein [Ignavibacteria bacterium]|nr:DUF262 domain-containing protein [Ignavibacteria bacterium]